MPLSPNINNREFDKFDLNSQGLTAVRVIADPAQVSDVHILAPTGPFNITPYTVTTTAANPLAIPLTARVSLSIRNKGANTVYFGNATVTADDTVTGGWEIGPGEDFNIDLDDSNVFYLIVASGTSTVKILEIAST